MTLHRVLGVRCERDALLHHLAPIGVAASRETALLVDLDEKAPGYPGRLTVADLVREGVRRSDLGPARKGVAVLGRGSAELDQVMELVDALVAGWPAVVIRAGSAEIPHPVIPVTPVFPATWDFVDEAAVTQPVAPWAKGVGDPSIRLPVLRRGQVAAMLGGRVSPRWRWVKAWRPVWDHPWV